MKRRLKALIVLVSILGIPAMLLGWVYHSSRSRGIPVGQRFPSIRLNDLDGNPAKIDKTTLLVFFHSACPHCQKQLANLEELHRRHRSDHLRIIAASLDDKETTVAFLRDSHFSYPIVMDIERSFTTRLKEKAIPALYLIDETGIVKYKRHGYREIETDDRIVREFVTGSEEKDGDPCECESEQKKGDHTDE